MVTRIATALPRNLLTNNTCGVLISTECCTMPSNRLFISAHGYLSRCFSLPSNHAGGWNGPCVSVYSWFRRRTPLLVTMTRCSLYKRDLRTLVDKRVCWSPSQAWFPGVALPYARQRPGLEIGRKGDILRLYAGL